MSTLDEAQAARNAAIEARLLALLAQALDPDGKALAPLKQAYDLGYADGCAQANPQQPAGSIITH